MTRFASLVDNNKMAASPPSPSTTSEVSDDEASVSSEIIAEFNSDSEDSFAEPFSVVQGYQFEPKRRNRGGNGGSQVGDIAGASGGRQNEVEENRIGNTEW